jgi:hypothetical protein
MNHTFEPARKHKNNNNAGRIELGPPLDRREEKVATPKGSYGDEQFNFTGQW